MKKTPYDDLLEVFFRNESGFRVSRELLQRMGIFKVHASGQTRLYQTVYILHSASRYFLVHYKQLYDLDMGLYGNPLNDYDQSILTSTAKMLYTWGIIDVADRGIFQIETPHRPGIVAHADRERYNLISPHSIGETN